MCIYIFDTCMSVILIMDIWYMQWCMIKMLTLYKKQGVAL